MRVRYHISRVLMSLSPHKGEELDREVEATREDVKTREAAREAAAKKHRDYMDLQLRVLGRK